MHTYDMTSVRKSWEKLHVSKEGQFIVVYLQLPVLFHLFITIQKHLLES